MCGRYLLTAGGDALERYFGLLPGTAKHTPRFNIAPGQEIPVIRRDSEVNSFSLMLWGFVPRWSKEGGAAKRMINARAETIDQKPFFRESFLRRRCLIPADGFYEWKRAGRFKQPVCIRLPQNSLFAFAGIWDVRKNPDGSDLFSCCIVTTAANEFMKEIHDRMPAILDDSEAQRLWLDPRAPAEDLKELLRPYSGEMIAYPVSPLVNSPDVDVPECAQMLLFS